MFQKQIATICKTSFFHVRQIARRPRFLSDESVKTLVHAFVKCILDNYHYYTWENLIQKLQRGPKLCCTTYHEREKRENVTTPPRCHENFTGSRLTNALSLKFCFSPNIALHLVAAFYIQDLLTRNFRSSSSNLLAGNVEFSNLKTYRVCSFGMIRIESLSRVDSSVHLIYHDPSDLGSLIPIRIISKERTQVTVRSQSVLQNI